MSSNKVFVGNLAYKVSWQDLKDHMRQAGPVAYAKVFTRRDGLSKGCGIVEFETAEAATKAINELHDSELMGRLMFVREDRDEGY